jgi:phage virion morphogenesis protein
MAAAGVTLTVTAAELGEVGRRLSAVATLTAKPTRLMKAIGAALESSTKRRFRTNVAPDGSPWKPSVRALRTGGRTLLDKAHLRDSITSDADDTQAVVGSNLIYAAIHQEGGVIRPKNAAALVFNIPGVGWRRVNKVTIPARPFLGVSEDDRDNIGDLVAADIAGAVA